MAGLLQLPPALDRRLRGELEEGETLLWTGQPRPAAWVHKGIGVMPFGALFLGFLVWMNGSGTGETEGGAGLNLPLMFVIPFGLAGAIMLLAPVLAVFVARRTAYGLTDRRAIVIEPLPGSPVRSYSPAKLQAVERKDGSLGSDLIFYREWRRAGRNSRFQKLHGFLGIRDAREVEQLVRDLAMVHAHPE